MMKNEKSRHESRSTDHQFQPQNNAHQPSLSAEILDITQSGIRVKINHPQDCCLHGRVKITMTLPKSGTPFTVNCLMTNRQTNTKLSTLNQSVDDMLFNCHPLDDSMYLIKSQSIGN